MAVRAIIETGKGQRLVLLRLGALLGLATLPALLGFVIGIIPGLLLGFPGWHRFIAIGLPILWALGYVKQREANYGDVNWITYSIAFGGGMGLGASIWFFGTLTD